MRIAFDGSTLIPGRTGVGYYVEHLLHHLAREVAHTGDELVVLSNKPINTELPLPRHVRIHAGHQCPLRLGWMLTRAASALKEIRPDVAHFTNAMMPVGSPVETVITVHDMSLRLFPRFHPIRRVALNGPLMRLAIRQASSIVTVSESARRDLLRLHGVPPDRVFVVHEAASPAFRPITDRARLEDVRARYGLPQRFILYVGTIEPRKNLTRLMTAFAAARRAGMSQQLVCVGPYGWSSRDLAGHVQKLGIQQSVHFTGYLPFDHLPAIYNLADFFVFPSLYEGFGLPVVEAMASGLPVLTSKTSSLGEIAGDAAVTIDPTDTDAMVDAIRRLAADADFRRDRAEQGLRRARDFSWTQTAREMLAVYHRVAGVAVSSAPRSATVESAESAESAEVTA